MPCSISYIPKRLHSNGRPDINEFHIGEFLFRRCKEDDKANPFKNIKLYDLSVNRSGAEGNILSYREDVLLNTTPANGEGEKYNQAIATLEILELNEDKQYKKSHSHEKDYNGNKVENSCTLYLRHRKEECNYSHCEFEVYFDEVKMTFDNFNIYLGKHSQLRTWAKNEFAKMIVKDEVRINWDETNDEGSS